MSVSKNKEVPSPAGTAEENLAVTVFEGHISPRFDCCQEIELITLDRVTGEYQTHTISLMDMNPPARIALLVRYGVGTLLCGGLTCWESAQLDAAGIRTIPWLQGLVKDIITDYANGRLNPEPPKQS